MFYLGDIVEGCAYSVQESQDDEIFCGLSPTHVNFELIVVCPVNYNITDG